MEDSVPFGYSHRQKRSYAQTGERDRSTPPAWSSNLHNTARESSLNHLHSFCPSYSDSRPPANSNHLRFSLRRPSPGASSSHPHTARPGSASAPHRSVSGLHLPQIGDMESAAPRRFAGDGFDYRRPAGPAQEQVAEPVDLSAEEDEAEAEGDSDMIDLSRDEDGDVIDLTADDSGYGASHDGNSGGARGNDGASSSEQPNRNRRRLPRGMDIIIDLDNGEEEWRMATPRTEARASPEIEFISSRTIDVPNEVEFVRSNALPVDERRRREHQEMDRVLDRMDMHGLHGHITHLRAHVERFGAHMNRAAADLQRRGPEFPPRRPNRGRVHAGFAMPGPMDFHTVAFDVNFGAPARPAAPPATYTAPPKAPDGFTRSPEEEGPLICPNCEEDLCVGDDEVKRQVWIVKGCGHVYCGECAVNRSTKRSSKGKEKPPRTKPFKECLVEECGKKVTNPKAMFQIFL